MKPIDCCVLCNRWRPSPYIRGQWISPEVTPPGVEFRMVTCEDCKEKRKGGEHVGIEKPDGESLRLVQGVEKNQ